MSTEPSWPILDDKEWIFQNFSFLELSVFSKLITQLLQLWL